jgi:alginate O-acetyltransferase complex protein AlgI
MLFNSLQFLVFFPVVTLLYFLMPHRFRWLLLLVASCVFYCAFIWYYIFILFFTIGVDYVAGIYIEKSTGARRKQFLTMSIVANIGVLAIFKYCNFFLNNYNHFLHGFHVQGYDARLWGIILPIGLSFHTFQAMSYTIEVYRGHQKAERHLGIYALYVMFYPQLLAGPIERPQHMLPQFYERHYFNWDNLWAGLRLMLWGLFKKSVMADRLDIYVNPMFSHPESYHPGNVLLAVVFFSFVAYCDFSGYSDMAIGAARVMGFSLMKNFDRPLLSPDIMTFWRRWHISLSTWFRDYLYISIGGNRVSAWRQNMNLFIVFLVSGFWHGAAWTYVIWGSLHGVYVILYSNFKKLTSHSSITLGKNLSKVKYVLGVLITFSMFTSVLVFFRSSSLGMSVNMIRYICSPSHMSWLTYPVIGGLKFGSGWFAFVLFLFVFMLVAEEVMARCEGRFSRYGLVDSVVLGLVLFLVLTMGVFNNDAFIYFQF